MAFPTLSQAPVSCTTEIVDDTIKSQSEAGYVQTRPRFTRRMHKFAGIRYILEAADMALLMAHADTVKGSTIFAWTHPTSAVTYNVRYSPQPKSEPMLNAPWLYSVEFGLEEA